ncbi:hypothetical protein [Bremerella sp.]|uniref:hypothetical protein n=1 Tax=Bremerella sp. TaxID=2795602 RepID=UPI003918A407
MDQRQALLRISIAEAIAVLTILCLLIGAIWAPWWVLEVVFFVVAMVALLAIAIACTATGEPRTFAAGFAIMLVGYLVLSMAMHAGLVRLSAYYFNKPPMTDLWDEAYELIRRDVYKYRDDGQAIPSSLEPYKDPQGYILDKQGNVLGIHGVTDGKLRGVQILSLPAASTYLVVGELLWALSLSYLGGKFVIGFRRYQENARKT